MLSALGLYGTWILGGSNGTFKTISALTLEENPKFPGTTAPLLTNYTGFKSIDQQLAILVTFFAPVVDGRSGALYLFSIFGMGQFGGIWTLMVLESMRMGNVGKWVSW